MKRTYWTVKIPKPTLKDLETLCWRVLMVSSGLVIFGAMMMILCLMTEIFFKVKLLH